MLLGALALGVAATPQAPDGPPSGSQDWRQFRGPGGRGIAVDPVLPTTWSATDNIVWSATVPGMGWSSPIVTGDLIVVTSVVSSVAGEEPVPGLYFGGERPAPTDPHRWVVYAHDVGTGELRWETELHAGIPDMPRHLKNSYASETPVTDGKAVYAYFAHQGLYAYDFDGNQLWATPLKAYPVYLELGGGASPALHGDRIYILNDNNEASFIAAFDKHDGHELWRTPRVGLGDNHHSGWSSPFVWENDLRYELVTIGPTTAISYDMAGSELWRMGGMATMPIPTPFASDDHLYLVSGPPSSESRPIATVRAGARGDITMPEGATSSADVVWYDWRGGTYLSTPVLYEGKLYVLQHNGIIVKYDAGTGEVVYRSRIAPEARNFTASPWAYNGMVFCLSEEGDTYVIGTGDEYELLGVNRLDDFSLSTPAMVGDRLLLRTHHNLWSIRSLRSS